MMPLVSALMPTFNRRAFIPRAIKCFQKQDYPNLELIVLDDGPDPIKDLLPDDPRIKYFRDLPQKNHGQKMNICCEYASGEYCIVHDDDDVYPTHRISHQIQPMIDSPALMLTGTSTLYFVKEDFHQAWHYTSPPRVNWLASIAFRKKLWENHKFEPSAAGSDYKLQLKLPPSAKLDIKDPTLVVAAVHPANACKKTLGPLEYRPVTWETVRGLLE
jgi:glycosyltransferase involved in cell wall biosynthesis